MERDYSHYIYFGFVVVLVVLALLIARQFLTALVLGAIFAYWFMPLHKKLASKIHEMPSAIVMSVSLFLILLATIQYGLYIIIRELNKAATYFQGLDVSQVFNEIFGGELSTAVTLKTVGSKTISALTNSLSDTIYALPWAIIMLFVFIMVFFYMLKDGEKILVTIKKSIPFPPDKRKRVIQSIKAYMDAFLKAELVIAITQGVVCAIGFYLFGLKHYILIGALLAALLSVLPIIGPYLLYLPVGTVMALQGHTAAGLGILIYGLAIGSFLDYVIRPNLTGKYASMHPLSVLIGILGGFQVFGIVGIFIGPIVLGICVTLLETMGENTPAK